MNGAVEIRPGASNVRGAKIARHPNSSLPGCLGSHAELPFVSTGGAPSAPDEHAGDVGALLYHQSKCVDDILVRLHADKLAGVIFRRVDVVDVSHDPMGIGDTKHPTQEAASDCIERIRTR